MSTTEARRTWEADSEDQLPLTADVPIYDNASNTPRRRLAKMLPPFSTNVERKRWLFYFAAVSFLYIILYWGFIIDNAVGTQAISRMMQPANVAIQRDLTKGYWIPSEKHRADILLWDLPDSCLPDLSSGKVASEDISEIAGKRYTDVAAWEWMLEDGSALYEWNIKQFILRGMESRIGWVIIGDSLAVQSLVAIEKLLRADNNPILVPNAVLAGIEPRIYVNASTATLYAAHPFYQQLIDENPHIPRARFDRPFIWTYRSDMLITNDELDAIMAGLHVTLGAEHRSQSNWTGHLAEMENLEGWDSEKEAIVQISTGPHWSPLHMHPSTDEEIIYAYRQMIQMVKTKLLNLPRTFPFRVFFRSTAPAHQNCNTYNTPVSLTSSVAQNPSPNKTAYGWHLYPTHNAIAKAAFDNGASEIEWWDIWDMSVQRPDAHRGWHIDQFDCLHWCSPSVPEWWVKTLWHRVMTGT